MAEPAAAGPLFDFTVPDELLVEAVSRSRDRVRGADSRPASGVDGARRDGHGGGGAGA